MDEECYNPSVRLDRVMDLIGASEDIREKRLNSCVFDEVLHNVVHTFYNGSAKESLYKFGSSSEGTTTHGLNSDTDYLTCNEELPVIERIEDAPRDRPSLLIVTDVSTQPGYVKLQSVLRGVPQTTAKRRSNLNEEMIDLDGRICRAHTFLPSSEFEIKRNGPAHTYASPNSETDYVNAFRCQKVPSIGNTWLHRKRPCGWPSRDQLQTMESYGCFFVGVCHPKSFNKDIEWRISFSLQERRLMSSLNIYQHKCYILLKMIKNDIIQAKAGKSITSYHCKTCLLYTIENSTNTVWTRGNIIQCTHMCLERLLRWVQKGHCPNYFIPDENMFDRLDRETLTRVAPVLKEVLTSGVGFLFSLKCDKVGELMNKMKNVSKDSFVHTLHASKQAHTTSIFIKTIYLLYQVRTILLFSMSQSNEPEEGLALALIFLQSLQDTDRIIGQYTTREVRMVLDAVTPYVHLQIAQCMVSLMLTNRATREPHMVSRMFLQHFLSSFTCDLISSRLILATYCLQAEMRDVAEEILLSCATSLKPHVVSVCGCYANELTVSTDKSTTFDSSFEEFRSRCTTGCIVIPPSQAKFVHLALRYEMYRSLYIQRAADNNIIHALHEWMAVDSQVYMYFLQYILYSNTDKPTFKQDSVNRLRNLINADPNLGHRETAFNLLGWIYTHENRAPEAWLCFCRSLRIRPLHNAAVWHLAVMLNEQIS